MSRASAWFAAAGLLMAVCVPARAQFAPPTEAPQYAATVVTLTGRVSVMKDNQPWALSSGDTIQVKQVIVSGPDGHAVFKVSDGSTFEVFPNSHVVFRKNAPNWRDLIDVIVGRVKVHIQHWGDKPNPNRIFTPTAVISVRGTTFDVTVDEESEATLVEVVEGAVQVQHALQAGDGILLQTGESITVYRNVPLVARGIDKGAAIQRALRALADAVQTMATRTPRGGTGGVGGSPGGTVGDTEKPAPPPPPPPPGPPL